MLYGSQPHDSSLVAYFNELANMGYDDLRTDARLMLQLFTYLEQQEGGELWASVGHATVKFYLPYTEVCNSWATVFVTQQRFHITYPWMWDEPSPWLHAEIVCTLDDIEQTGQFILSLVHQQAPPKMLRIAAWLEEGSRSSPTVGGIDIPHDPTPLRYDTLSASETLVVYYTYIVQQQHPLLSPQAQSMLDLLPLLVDSGIGHTYWVWTENTNLLLSIGNYAEPFVAIQPGDKIYKISYPLIKSEFEFGDVRVVGTAEDKAVALRMILVALQRTFSQP